MLNAHGWFSYDMKVRPNAKNTLFVRGKGDTGTLSIDINIDGEMTRHCVEGEGILEISRTFSPQENADKVVVRIDRNSKSLPFIYTLMIK